MSFHGLPAEIRVNILELLAPQELLRMCLSNKQVLAEAYPLLYRVISPFDVSMIDKTPDGITVPLIQDRMKTTQALGLVIPLLDPKIAGHVQNRLRRFISAVPKEQLNVVAISPQSKLDLQAYIQYVRLVKSQTKAHTVVLPTFMNPTVAEFASLSPVAVWLRCECNDLKNRELNVFMRQGADVGLADIVLKRASRLKTLCVCAYGGLQWMIVRFIKGLGLGDVLTLDELSIYRSDVSCVPLASIDFEKLKILELVNFPDANGVNRFLRSLADMTLRIQRFVLRSSRLHEKRTDEIRETDLLQFIKSFWGATEISVQLPWPLHLDPREVIDTHKEALRNMLTSAKNLRNLLVFVEPSRLMPKRTWNKDRKAQQDDVKIAALNLSRFLCITHPDLSTVSIAPRLANYRDNHTYKIKAARHFRYISVNGALQWSSANCLFRDETKLNGDVMEVYLDGTEETDLEVMGGGTACSLNDWERKMMGDLFSRPKH
ncbi:hypothetical protein BDV96DRAFT_604508 [Lophiotrema nucula]|uniref:F-box domain-containing protein n=1 Tax=Lophiotrema nucula TaxID=690887 RepID=A0A6A5YRL0_9PLEO|nr:hypothetical protein BDV96DRAFT_604508 [Lophiotrema nucula]